MSSDLRDRPIQVVMTDQESKRVRVLAAQEGKTVSSYVRDILLKNTRLHDDSFFASTERQTVHSERQPEPA